MQKTAAKVLGLSMHNIEVDVTRLGGGFGGKEDQATPCGSHQIDLPKPGNTE